MSREYRTSNILSITEIKYGDLELAKTSLGRTKSLAARLPTVRPMIAHLEKLIKTYEQKIYKLDQMDNDDLAEEESPHGEEE